MKTPPPPDDVESLFPFLRGRARTATRLHPRRAAEPLGRTQSKLGGDFAWPRGEPMPRSARTRALFRPVLQLRREDMPALPFPEGTDLFQLLWDPDDLDSIYLPRLVVRYRQRAALRHGAAVLEAGEPRPDSLHVRECALRYEAVTGYPYPASLPAEEVARIQEWEGDSARYQYLLSTCPGTKVGGYPQYFGQDDFSPPAPFEYVLTISDSEWDGGSGPRWQPVSGGEWEPIGTYIKGGFNLFVDRTRTPWVFAGAR